MLTDFNSDFGIKGQPFIVTNEAAVMNIIKNLFRQTPNSDRYEYVTKGLDLERLLKDPPSPAGATQIYMLIVEILRNDMNFVNLDTRLSSVTPNGETGEYDILLVLDGSQMSFSL